MLFPGEPGSVPGAPGRGGVGGAHYRGGALVRERRWQVISYPLAAFSCFPPLCVVSPSSPPSADVVGGNAEREPSPWDQALGRWRVLAVPGWLPPFYLGYGR